jgi:hypothetical protein
MADAYFTATLSTLVAAIVPCLWFDHQAAHFYTTQEYFPLW